MRPVVSPLAAFLALALLPSPATGQDSPAADPCEGSSTPEINACYSGKLHEAEARMQRYFEAAVARHLENREDAVALGLRNSQRAFEAYREIACAAVYEHWKGGTIRGLMDLTCSIALTDQRAHAIWASWLTYPDGTPPTLPEPMPTE